jgi:hypothetical protein
MSYFKNIKITDENGQVIEGVDLRQIEEKDILYMILRELQKMNLHLSLMTDITIRDTEVD